MAPKKTKPSDKKARDKVESPCVQFPSEKERFLQKEHGFLTEDGDTYTQRVQHFQSENEFLDKEAQEIRENSKAYLGYLTKRTVRCQNAIITLNDQNRSDLAHVLKQTQKLTSQYTDKEKEVRSQLIEMETKYSLMNKEVEELKSFKELQSDQMARIRELEKELLAMKIHHSEQTHNLKNQFLQQKAEYEMASQQKVQALARKAEKGAVRSLIQHTKQVKAENWQLRHELLNLIRRAQGLKSIVHQLSEQKEQLLRELRYRENLADIRLWLTQQGLTSCTPSSHSQVSGDTLSSNLVTLPQGSGDKALTSVVSTEQVEEGALETQSPKPTGEEESTQVTRTRQVPGQAQFT